MDALAVRGQYLLSVVGESYRQDVLQQVATTASDVTPFVDELDDYALDVADEEDRSWFRAALVREPDNPVDPGAVAVHAAGVGVIGYLSRADAAKYGPVLDSAAKRGFDALSCPAMLTGGEGVKSYGVVLAIASPGHILGDLHGEQREAERASRRAAKDERERAIYEAALVGDKWETIAKAHGYETASGAMTAARRYAERHGLELPPRQRGRRSRDS